ncbi:hypothetical protein Y032_0228g2880 [Ancylostoma ceylanicum]|uniref:Uncharacterized protein n=1 Tax=Ancylostoma ceylanicum TaxID=53326 RepID=A0A016SGL7_9BILA|nr:hypothetical protein Y032_0228g2880 [Ancylostoma ceylanicum]
MNFGIMLWNVNWCFHHVFCTFSKAQFLFFLSIHFSSDIPTFVVVFEGESTCTRPLEFVPNCLMDSNSIAREWIGRIGHEIMPIYAGGNAQQSGSPVLSQVIWYWRHVPQSYGLKSDDVNAVLKALLEAATR